MIQSLKQLIVPIDLFGVQFQFTTLNSHGKQYKSIFGGLYSTLVYLVGMLYFTYLTVLWMSSSLSPVVTTNRVFDIHGTQIEMTYEIFALQLFQDSYDQVFNEELHRLEAKGNLFKVDALNLYQSIPLKQNPPRYDCQQGENDRWRFFQVVCPNIRDKQQEILQASQLDGIVTHIYRIQYCDPATDDNCLALEDQRKFRSIDNTWYLSTLIQDFDLITGEMRYIPKYYAYSSLIEENLHIDLNIIKTKVTIDSGIIFQQTRTFDIVSEVQVRLTPGLKTEKPGIEVRMALEMYSFDKVVRYPKFSEIISAVVTTLQSLLVFGFLFSKLNTHLLISDIKEKLMQMYFPQCSTYTIKYDWLRRIKDITRFDQPIEPEQYKHFVDFNGKVERAIDSQLSLFTLLNQINKIQLTLQMILPKKQIRKLQDVNYQMRSENQLKITQESNRKDLLDEEDFLYLYPKQEDFTSGRVYPISSPASISERDTDRNNGQAELYEIVENKILLNTLALNMNNLIQDQMRSELMMNSADNLRSPN